MKKLFIILIAASASCFAHEQNELNQKMLNQRVANFIKVQICTGVTTSPPSMQEKIRKGSYDESQNFSITEWTQSSWGGRHQTSDSIKTLVELKPDRLTVMRLSQCGIDDEDLKNVAKLVSLKELDLYNNPKLTDEGILCLKSLKALERLRLTRLEKDPKFKEETIEELQEALPNCKIEF